MTKLLNAITQASSRHVSTLCNARPAPSLRRGRTITNHPVLSSTGGYATLSTGCAESCRANETPPGGGLSGRRRCMIGFMHPVPVPPNTLIATLTRPAKELVGVPGLFVVADEHPDDGCTFKKIARLVKDNSVDLTEKR